MVVMNTSTGMTMAPGSPLTPEKAQQLANQQNKTQQNQQQQQAQQQQQQAVLMQQQAMQQQGLQQFQFQQGQQTQHIQSKPMMSMTRVVTLKNKQNCDGMNFTAMQTIQGIPQQQIQVQQGDRPVMPVVSMPAQPTNQAVQQTMQQPMPATIQQSIPLQPNLAVTQQPMQMGMQQIQPVSTSVVIKLCTQETFKEISFFYKKKLL